MAQLYNHVVVIGIDGMGNFNGKTSTPFMESLFKNGAESFKGLSMDPTISAENWGAMLLGTKPTVHKLTNGIVGRVAYENDNIPSVFRRIREAMPEAYLASYSNWNPINHGIIEHTLNVDKVTADNDDDLCKEIVKAVAEKPTFLFVQFDDVDGAGHHFGYGTEGHLNRITATDNLVKDIYDSYVKNGIIEDTLFVVTADHGGFEHSHGGYNDTEKYVYIGAVGKTVQAGDVITGYQTRDIAAIVLYALGVAIPEYDEFGFSSEVPGGIFKGKNGAIRPEPKPNYPASKPTPAIDGKDGLYSFINKEDVELCLFFDNDLKDATGKYETKEYHICKYYSNGIFGSYGEFGLTGRVEVPALDLNKGNFSVSLWLKINRAITKSNALFTARDLGNGQSVTGISLQMRCNDTMFVMADDDDDLEVTIPFPDSISEGWLNVIVSVDRENKKVSFFDDFEFVNTIDIPERYLGEICNLPFTVGDNSLGNFNTEKFPGTVFMDDFIVFNKAFTQADVDALAKYYNK